MQNKQLVALVSGNLTQSEAVTLKLMNDWRDADLKGYEAAVKSLFVEQVNTARTGSADVSLVVHPDHGVQLRKNEYMTDGKVYGPNNTIVTVRQGRVVSIEREV